MLTKDSEGSALPSFDIEVADGAPRSATQRAASDSKEAFQSAWFRAVALAWSDATKLEALVRDPACFLQAHCGYRMPDNVDLTVREAGDGGPDGARFGWDSGRETWNLPRAEVTVYVPPAPRLEEQMVALGELRDPAAALPVCL